jgi:hypothetical protein
MRSAASVREVVAASKRLWSKKSAVGSEKATYDVKSGSIGQHRLERASIGAR